MWDDIIALYSRASPQRQSFDHPTFNEWLRMSKGTRDRIA